MEMVAPAGTVYQAGTFSGNPLSLVAGSAAVNWLHDHRNAYAALDDKTRAIEENLSDMGNGSFVRLGSMFKYFFRHTAPRNYREVKECDTGSFQRFWTRMLDAGIFLPPSQFETNFLSVAHSDQDIETIISAYNSCR
jgi:glutamate-1-semialdehyde 2,1-aminomutase